jgi:23S rRNA pseudouridine2605 synthase
MSADREVAEPIRLQKALAAAGVGSRRHCEELIAAGRVAVNGVVVRELGTKVVPTDQLKVDGAVVGDAERHVYYAVHKPVGYVSTADDPEGRPTVLDLVSTTARVYPVGRLDYDSEGLLILTNDGELTQLLLHPSHEVEREYEVHVVGEPTPAQLRQLREGVVFDGQRTAPAEVRVVQTRPGEAWLLVAIHEGRKRQIRRMCDAVGLRVDRLVRVRVGPLMLGDLPEGRYRALRSDEVRQLRAAARSLPAPDADTPAGGDSGGRARKDAPGSPRSGLKVGSK